MPELTDLSKETQQTLDLYGPEVTKPGTFAASALLARRLVERGVRVVQILHRGWDQHGNLPRDISSQCDDTDQPTAALLADLKQRGLLDSTLVVWGGEFGRTVYSQGKLTQDNYGRDHHPRNFCMWLAGGGVEGGHRRTARPTTSATTSSRTRCTSTISTPRSCTAWASTTSGSRSSSRGSISGCSGVESPKVIKELLA